MKDLITFLNESPVNFLATETVRRELENAGFTRLNAEDAWNIAPDSKYYITKNDSAIFAFITGTDITAGYKIITAHSDSPCFRVKPHPEMLGEGNVLQVNTEVYGGPILYTWFDRPLSLAGRVFLRSDNPLRPTSRLIDFRRPLLTIPHLAIHFNRKVNEGNAISPQKDMMPVLAILKSRIEADNFLLRLISDNLGVSHDEILDFDLSLYDTTPACTVGVNNEFISSGRLDDLSMVHAAMSALLSSSSAPQPMTRVMAIFDNEETGSGTKQGAASPVLSDLFIRINNLLGGSVEDYQRAIAKSFMVSADNGHALHPNYVSKHDPTNHPVLGGGPVIKINANCKYMTDADSAAVFRRVCEIADVPYQYFVNNSDIKGGSTLGNILTSQIPLRGVDMGAPVWAMHSVRETASVADHQNIIKAFTKFYDL